MLLINLDPELIQIFTVCQKRDAETSSA